jgi:predicted nucleic acid-binding protein
VDLLREARRQELGPATRFLDSHAQEELCASVLVSCELHAGAALAPRPSVERARVQQLCEVLRIVYPDERSAPVYGQLLASLTRGGVSISNMDLLIATSAVIEEAPLATRNVKDCRKVPG